MRLFLNLNNGIVTTAIHLSLAANANARRGGREQVELQLHRDRVPERLPENWLILLGVKETGRYDAPAFLTQASDWTRPDADEGFYTAWLPTDTGPINSLLHHDEDDTNDIPAVATMAQIDWRPDLNTPPSKSQSFTVNFQSAVNNGDETPTEPEIPFAALFRQKYLAVADATARLALTVEHVHNGDVVREIGRAEVTKITCLGSTYASTAQVLSFNLESGLGIYLGGVGFLIGTTTDQVLVWFYNGSGTPPSVGDRSIEVVVTGDLEFLTGFQLAEMAAAAIDADAAFSATAFDISGSGMVEVTNMVAGVAEASVDVNMPYSYPGFYIDISVAGAAAMHTLQGKSFILLNGAGQEVSVGFGIAGGVGNIAVTLPPSTQTDAQIAALMQPLIHAHADFSAVQGTGGATAEVTVTNAANGFVKGTSYSSASAASSGFTVAVLTAGKTGALTYVLVDETQIASEAGWKELPTVIGFSAINSSGSNQTLSGGVNTKLNFTTQSWDSHNQYEPTISRFICRVPGKYLFSGQIDLTNAAATSTRKILELRKNGSELKYLADIHANTPIGQYQIIGGPGVVADLIAGDVVELYASASAGGTVQFGVSYRSLFHAIRITA
jgi:hypothetical protein